MGGFLLDTNVLSELRKNHCHPSVARWADAQKSEDLYTSVVVLAEIRFGITQVNEVAFRTELDQWLQDDLRAWYANRLLPIDEDVMVRWRELLEKGRKANYTFGQPDLFLAAQADIHGLTVVTRNVRDFAISGVSVLNPWEFEAAIG